MVHVGEGEEDDWELLEAATDPAPSIAPVAEPASEPAAFEDDFYLVDGDSGDASCESDGGMETPRQSPSDDDLEEPAGGEEPQQQQPPPAPAEPQHQEEVAAPAPALVVQAKESGTESEAASDCSSTTVDEEPNFRCQGCKIPVFKSCDVLSSNYHAQTSPGYLLGAIHNVQVSEDEQSAVYTTGRYSIQEVTCKQCRAVLGVTYSGASDARNQYKVGKFLVGRDRLMLPDGVVHPMDKKN